ncbi:MAG: hypothetical protein Kow0075_15420 [Salibacteraceae bacterium]
MKTKTFEISALLLLLMTAALIATAQRTDAFYSIDIRDAQNNRHEHLELSLDSAESDEIAKTIAEEIEKVISETINDPHSGEIVVRIHKKPDRSTDGPHFPPNPIPNHHPRHAFHQNPPAPKPAGKRGFMGIAPDDTYEDEGVRIKHVIRNSPAERSGLLAGDVIVSVNGEPVGNFAELVRVLEKYNPGDELKVAVDRGEQTEDHYLTLADTQHRPHGEGAHQGRKRHDEVIEIKVKKHAAGVHTKVEKRPVNDLPPPARWLETEEFSIGPNPATDHLNVSLKIDNDNPVTIRLLNAAGAVLKELRVKPDNGRVSQRIDVSTLPPGAYHLRVEQNGKIYSAGWLKS